MLLVVVVGPDMLVGINKKFAADCACSVYLCVEDWLT